MTLQPKNSPVLSLIDSHQHFQDLTHHSYPWLADRNRPETLEGDLEAIRRDYLPDAYASDLATADVRGTVHIQNGWNPADPIGETRWLDNLAATTGRPDAIVAFTDLADPGVEQVLAGHTESPRLRGIRQILNWHEEPRLRVVSSPELMADTKWLRGFALLRQFELSFDLQIYWPQMSLAAGLARNFPDTCLILNHFGMPVDRSQDGIAAWATALAELARAPNVFVKLSGFGLGAPNWTLADTVPLLRRTISIFGPDRTMIGTNLPVDGLFANPRKILAAIEATVSWLSPSERAAVLTGTATRVYRV